MKPTFFSYGAAVVLIGLALGNFTPEAAKASVPERGIAVYATPENNGSITVQSNKNAAVDFYLFDVEGTLIYRTGLKVQEKQTVTGLGKGTYVYNAFCNDRPLKNGQVVLP